MTQNLHGALQSCMRGSLPTRTITPPSIALDFHDVFAAQLRDVEQIVLQEVARLDNAALQLRSEKDGLMRDLAEARGLMPPRAFRDGHELQMLNGAQQGEAGANKSGHGAAKLSGRSDVDHSKTDPAPKTRSIEKLPSESKHPKDNRRDLLLHARKQERLISTNSSGASSMNEAMPSNLRQKQRSATSASPTRGNTRSGTALQRPKMTHAATDSDKKGHFEIAESRTTTDSSLPDYHKFVRHATARSPTMAAAAAAAARFAERTLSTRRQQSVASDPSEPEVDGSNRVAADGSIVPRRHETPKGSGAFTSSPVSSPDHSTDQTQMRKGFTASAATTVHIEAQPPAMGKSSTDGAAKSQSQTVQKTQSDAARKSKESIHSSCPSMPGNSSTISTNGIQFATEAATKSLELAANAVTESGPTSSRRRRPSIVSSRSGSSGAESQMTFELLPNWVEKMLEQPASPTHKKLRRSMGGNGVAKPGNYGDEMDMQQLNSTMSAAYDSSSGFEQFMLRTCMIPPTSLVCVTWELWGLLMIGYDFVFLPLQIFTLQDSTFMVAMEWIQRIFWTISIPFSFFVGYVLKDGKVELRPSKVRRHYCCTWFPFDFTVVVSDWAEVILKTFEFLGAMRLVKTVRVSRILRMIRVFRTIKLPKAMESLDMRIFSEKTVILLGIGKISLLFMGLSHLIACTWYGVGRYGSQDDYHGGWVMHYGYLNESLSYRYMTSLHWALTQFIGSMDVQPRNLAERSFANVMLLCSFVITAWFVSSITAQITRLQIIAGGRDGQFAVLRQYLWHHKITTKLAMRVVRSAQQALDQQTKNASEKDVELLSFVSEPLRAEIHYEMYYNTLSVHPFFRHCDDLNRHVVRELCNSGIEVISAHDGDMLFTAGEVPTNLQMYFIVGGLMGYSWEDATFPVTERMWACEAVLWIDWVHLGNLQAYHAVTIQAVDADIFRQVLTKGQREAVIAANYAQRFVTYLNQNWDAVLDVNMDLDHERWMSEAVAEVKARAEALSCDFAPRRSAGVASKLDPKKDLKKVVDLSSIAPSS
mmetsp:Transcript_13917/g.24332  ORF Transcript_13917/g.24332 Transcript_13917/m.24332 type:complete len:1043 (-) Transcript_13917:29-3157(-)